MNVGTKSILFGVHQFLWHPWTVGRAWRYLYGVWPTFAEWVCIFCHDLGYWGKPDMDGDAGRRHPVGGANLSYSIVYWWNRLRFRSHDDSNGEAGAAYRLSLYHSIHYAELNDATPSKLYLPDKVCVLFDPLKFYLWRARASKEIREYVRNSPFADNYFAWMQDHYCAECRGQELKWFRWYRGRNSFKALKHFAKKWGWKVEEA